MPVEWPYTGNIQFTLYDSAGSCFPEYINTDMDIKEYPSPGSGYASSASPYKVALVISLIPADTIYPDDFSVSTRWECGDGFVFGNPT